MAHTSRYRWCVGRAVDRSCRVLAGIAAALLVALPAPSPAALPSHDGSAPALSLLPWSSFTKGEPGVWVEYATLVGGHPVAPYLRVLLLGDGVAGGEKGTWIEVWISQRPGSASQAFRLLVGTGPGKAGAILSARVRLLGGRVQEIEPEAWAAGAGGGQSSGPGAHHILPDVVAVLTPAGSFPSRMARAGGAKIWISSAVPAFGLVRLDLPRGAGLELHAIGTGGRGVVEDAAPALDSPPPGVRPDAGVDAPAADDGAPAARE